MRAIFFKELREHLRWALLAFVAIGTAMAWALAQATNPERWSGGDSLLSAPFVQVMTFAGAICGLLLSLVQTLPERRPDRWALLVHRPVSRAAIFWGKVFAGWALYVFAVGTPFLAAARWCFIPGHVAGPVVPGMMLPGTVDLLAGCLFYLAGFAFALRKARWKGTKMVPFLGALAVFLAAHSSDYRVSPGLALAAVAIGGGLLLVVARNAFLDHGLEEGPSPEARVALAGLLFLALFAGGIAARDVVFQFFLGGEHYAMWSYQIGKNGEPVKQFERVGRHMVQESRLTDMDGHPLDEGDDIRAKAVSPATVALCKVPWIEFDGGSFRDPGAHAEQRYTERNPGQEMVTWYYVSFRGRVEGYGQKTRRLVGTLGPDGYAPGNAPNRPFDAKRRFRKVLSSELLAFPEGAFLVDPVGRVVRRSAGPDDVARSLSISALNDNKEGDFGPDFRVLLGLPDGIDILDRDGKPVVRLPHDPAFPPDQTYTVSVGIVPAGGSSAYAVLYAPYYVEERKNGHIVGGQKPGGLDRYDAEGRLVSSTALPPFPDTTAPLSPWLLWFDLSFVAIQPMAQTAPWLGAWLPGIFPWSLKPGGFYLSSDGFLDMPWSNYLVFALDFALSGLGARMAWRLLSRLPRAGRRIGAAMVFLLGPLGALALWIVRERSRTVPCPACEKGRQPQDERCAACGAPWPEPARDGREIFEREEAGV